MSNILNNITEEKEYINSSHKKARQKQLEKQIERDGSFADNFPDLLKEWDYEKNNQLNIYPNKVTAHSGKKVWWICTEGHEWLSNISTRTGKRKSGCPICKNRTVLEGFNDFASQNTMLLREWDYEKNNQLNIYPNEVTSHSEKKVWWICPICNNEYMATITHRVDGTKCPNCANELKTSFKEQAFYYYLKQVFKDTKNRVTINEKEVDIYIPSLKIAIEYDGAYYHENKKSLNREKEKYQILHTNDILLIRIKESFNKNYIDKNADKFIFVKKINNDIALEKAIEELIIYINNEYKIKTSIKIDIKNDKIKIYEQYLKLKKEENLLVKYPNIACQWNYEKNGKLLPDMVSSMSSKKVWWKCAFNHEWQAAIESRAKGSGCPYCAGQKVLIGINDLQTKFPEIAKEWDYKKNVVKPNEIFPATNKKYWWICSKGHNYLASPNSRTGYKKTGCLICSKKEVLEGVNDFASQNPNLLKEWDYEKNNKIRLYPTQIFSGSNKYAYWRCEKGHSWKAIVNSRTGKNGRGCPICKSKVVLENYNDLLSNYPDLIKEWDYIENSKNKIYPNKVTVFSNKKANWICNRCGNKWITSIYHRTSKGTKCPKCSQNDTISKSLKTRILKKGSFADNFPELLKEWDYEHNNKLNIFPDKITAGSHKYVYWKCKYNHVWKAIVKARTRVNGTGCPECYKNKNFILTCRELF